MASTEAQADYLDRTTTLLRINLAPWDFTSNPRGDLTAYWFSRAPCTGETRIVE